MSKEEYAELINHIITKMYQKTKTKINKEINFAKKIKLKNKMEQYAHQSAYVTLKDHKQNFKNKLLWWLIKPAKNEIGIVSKMELEKINRVITNQVKGNQWCKTQAVIDWFKSTRDKTKPQFINDIVEFYPYITQNLLNNAVSYEQTLKAFPNYIIQLFKQGRKSLVFNQRNADEKAKTLCLMLSWGRGISELVSIYLLGKLSNIIDNKNIALFRDDRLSIIENAHGPKLDHLRKDAIKCNCYFS